MDIIRDFFCYCYCYIMWGGWVKLSATMVGRRHKALILHWLKRAKTVPRKRNLDQKINSSKPHLWILSIDFKFSGRNTQRKWKSSPISQYSYAQKNITPTFATLTRFTPATQLKQHTRFNNWCFWNWTVFQHFNTSINSIERLKFSRQFGLSG